MSSTIRRYETCASETPTKTEMEARWKTINIQRNQPSICFDTFESNCNTDEQAADKQARLAVAVGIALKFIRKMYTISCFSHFQHVPPYTRGNRVTKLR